MILIGAGGHAKVILDILIQNNLKVDEILDANPPVSELFGVPVSLDDGQQASEESEAVIAVGNNRVRKKIAESRLLQYVAAVHPSSMVSRYARVGAGTVVMANAVINPEASIGKHCIINTGAVIEHDCVLEDYVHVSPNAAVAGNVTIGEGSHIGIGAVVIQGITIGKWVTVGAGAVIIRDVPDGVTVVGNPGRVI